MAASRNSTVPLSLLALLCLVCLHPLITTAQFVRHLLHDKLYDSIDMPRSRLLQAALRSVAAPAFHRTGVPAQAALLDFYTPERRKSQQASADVYNVCRGVLASNCGTDSSIKQACRNMAATGALAEAYVGPTTHPFTSAAGDTDCSQNTVWSWHRIQEWGGPSEAPYGSSLLSWQLDQRDIVHALDTAAVPRHAGRAVRAPHRAP